MRPEALLPIFVGLLPVASFLAALLYLDSYKLVKLRVVVAVLAVGATAAGVTYVANSLLTDWWAIDFKTLTRYVAPLLEECFKGLVIVVLIRTHRIGFLIDAAIFGFAAGTGFAMVENLYYLHLFPHAGLGIWIIRGFGTAIMHGGATAIFAVMGVALLERTPGAGVRALLPGYLLAVALHSAFNHFFLSPLVSTAGILLVLPPLLYAVFRRSEQAVGDWLGKGFDTDTEMLELINSDHFSDSPIGRYLHSLKDKFEGPVVADIFCYLQLHTELALRAKGILLMRESGFDAPLDDSTASKFAEMRYLRQSIGRTGLLALHQKLRMSHKDLWQIYSVAK